MKSIIHNVFSFIIAIIGFFGGLLWGIKSNWDYEPLILISISIVEIISYLIFPQDKANENTQSINSLNSHKISNSNFTNLKKINNQNESLINNVSIKINGISGEKNNVKTESTGYHDEKNFYIELKKNKISILFIDDDKNFNIVKILKDSGWKNTKTVVDVKTLDDNNIKNSEIIFVDINGVGKMLGLENEGLDLALMIKQKYINKKVIIYSANNNNNTFHEAWELADSRLAKNALPYQFQHLVEKYSADFYNN